MNVLAVQSLAVQPWIAHVTLVGLLAALAWWAGRRSRRPELAHVLWLVVFVKLLVPPLVEVPLLAPRAVEPSFALGASLGVSSLPGAKPDLSGLDLQLDRAAATWTAASVLGWVWALGALVFLASTALGFARFRRLLAAGRPADADLVETLRRLAPRVGLKRAPRVVVLDAAVSPGVVALPRATLVLPRALLPRLSEVELEAVLLHELAHCARRDPWVRLLEVLATSAYWWCPAVWWFRRELRFAEESACDARVLRASRAGARGYADALIQVTEFLARQRTAALPAFAAGASGSGSLERRLTRIMRGDVEPPRLRSRVLGGVYVAAMLPLLPLLPVNQGANQGANQAAPENALAAPSSYEPAVAPGVLPRPLAPTDELEPPLSASERAALQQVLELISAHRVEEARGMLLAKVGGSASAVFDFTLANLHFQAEEHDKAAAGYLAATKKHPTFRRAWKNLALLYVQRDCHAEALGALRKTIELGDSDAQNYGLLGVSFSRVGDLRGAESAYAMACLLDPGEPSWQEGLVSVLFQAGRYADALALLTPRMEREPDDDRLILLAANAHIGLGQVARAAELFQRIEQLGAATVDTRLTHGDLLVNQERFAEAVDVYRAALESDPAHDATRVLRATQLMVASGTYEEARELAHVLQGRVATQPELERELLRIRSRLAGEAVPVEAAHEPRPEPEPEEPPVLGETAPISELSELQALERLLALDPRDGEAWLQLGRLRARLGDEDAALDAYRRAASIEGHEADASVRIAQLHAKRGRVPPGTRGSCAVPKSWSRARRSPTTCARSRT